MPYFGEQQQQPEQQQWGQPQQQQWGQPQQQQWGQPQQQQWGQAQQQQQQWQPKPQTYQPVAETGAPQQTFSTVQDGEQSSSAPTTVSGAGPYPSPVVGQAPTPVDTGMGPIPISGGVSPVAPGVSPALQNLMTGLPNVQAQMDPGMGGGDPRMQMLLMMLAGGGGGQAPEQGETKGVKTRKIPDSWGSPPQVPQGEPPVSGNIPGFGMFNGPMTIANWISQSIADHGPMDQGQ